MAARAEHLVSYQTTTLRMREIKAVIANVNRALTAVVTSSQIGNLRTGRNTLEATTDVLRTDETGKVWLHTGDIAVMDESGRFAIVDRKKDMILAAGGFNVYPREIEDVLFEHPAVVDAGVIGVPVGGQDQRAKAFIVLEDGAAVDEEELIEFCRERLARYKIPRTIEFRDELPKTFVGKVLRRELMAEEQAKEGSAG